MFGKYFYNETIRKTVIAFGTLFNDITIKHTNDTTDAVISTIKVPIASVSYTHLTLPTMS